MYILSHDIKTLRHTGSKRRFFTPMNHLARKTRPTTVDVNAYLYDSYHFFNKQKAGVTEWTFPSGEHFQKSAHCPRSAAFASSQGQASVGVDTQNLGNCDQQRKNSLYNCSKSNNRMKPFQISSSFFIR